MARTSRDLGCEGQDEIHVIYWSLLRAEMRVAPHDIVDRLIACAKRGVLPEKRKLSFKRRSYDSRN
jgi:hypothetical protein